MAALPRWIRDADATAFDLRVGAERIELLPAGGRWGPLRCWPLDLAPLMISENVATHLASVRSAEGPRAGGPRPMSSRSPHP